MKTIQHKFVEYIPSNLEENVLYVSVHYRTAMHLCACGCASKIVTPISPDFWKLEFDGKTISLKPSIGNWSFDCKSHYWIRNNQIHQAGTWDDEKIKESRQVFIENKKNENKSVWQRIKNFKIKKVGQF